MSGFNFEYNTAYKIFPEREIGNNCFVRTLISDNFRVCSFFLNKFKQDKLFEDTEDFFILLDGVITNKADLCKAYISETWFDCVVNLYNTHGESFFSHLRGSFLGVFYDKKADKWLVFTDHIGSKVIYYSQVKQGIFMSSQMSDMYEYFRLNHIPYDLSLDAAYMLLSYGYMLDEFTLCERVKKLLPGRYLKIDNGEISIHKYYTLPDSISNKDPVNEDDIIEELDVSFRKAVSRQFSKDVEYGYKHLVALSGGLDSRMTSWVADELGYQDQFNFTFSQSDYLDEIIAKRIAVELKHEWIFKALDNGTFLKNMETVIRLSGGNVLFSGKSHGLSMLACLGFDQFGIVHSGQLGDVIVGSFLNDESEYKKVPSHAGYYSAKFLHKIQYEIEYEDLNLEKFLIYQRGFNGANSGLICTMNFAETLSPFYDVEFMEYCVSIPIQLRIDHYLYKKWVIRKYPQAARYVWEKTKRPVSFKSFYNVKYKGRKIPIEDIPRLIKDKYLRSTYASNTPDSMNPFDYWYSTNPNLRFFFDEYFKLNIKQVEDISQPLSRDLKELYCGTTLEKTQVLTLLGAIKLFY